MKSESAQLGQAIVFGAISLFMLVASIVLVYNIGMVAQRRIEVQQAADSAAYAAALVKANSISTIAWLNEGMAHIYYHLMRYAVDTAIYATLAELKEHGPPYPTDHVVGVPNPVGLYDLAYLKSKEWQERGHAWLKDIASIQKAIAIVTPQIMNEEIWRIARENGADRVCVFPEDMCFVPEPGAYFSLLIEKRGEGRWLVTEPQSGYSIRVEIDADGSFRAVTSNDVELEVVRHDANTWRFRLVEPNATLNGTLQTSPNGWFFAASGTGNYPDIETTSEGWIVRSEGRTRRLRRNDQGLLEEYKEGKWVPVPKTGEIVVDDVTLRVRDTGIIQIGRNTEIIMPDRIVLDNTIHITLGPQGPDISANIGMAWLSIDREFIEVNDLSTRIENGQWRRYHGGYIFTDDRARHRLLPEFHNRWLYEYVRAQSYLTYDNPTRFGIVHAIYDNDPYYRATGKLPLWTTWFDPRTGRSYNYRAYYQTRRCWHCGGSGKLYLTSPGKQREAGYGTSCTACHSSIDKSDSITCITCRGRDNDDDGFTDVRKFQADSLQRNTPNYQHVIPFTTPLVLTEDFFNFGITVGVWKKPTEDILRIFPHPPWGYFALAGARVGFYDVESTRMKFQFASAEARREWVWTSFANLYEPTWEARLFPVSGNIRAHDLEPLIERPRVVEPGVNFIYRMIMTGKWKEDWDGPRDYSVNALLHNIRQTYAHIDFEEWRREHVWYRRYEFRQWMGDEFNYDDKVLRESVSH